MRFFVIASVDEQNASCSFPLMQVYRPSAAQIPLLRRIFPYSALWGTRFGLHIEDSIVNTRAIGAVMGGCSEARSLGGLVGLTGTFTAIRWAVTALSCMISTIVMAAQWVSSHSYMIKRGRPDKAFQSLTPGRSPSWRKWRRWRSSC